MEFGLKGKTALVTGGSSGLGLAIAKTLSDEGARVIITSRDAKKLALAAKGLGNSTFYAMDISKEEEIKQTVSKILSETPVDILVNNTGGPATGTPLTIGVSDWDKGYQSLIRSVVLLTQLIVPKMRERRWGRILTVTSTSARQLIPKLPVSSTFRAGLTAFAKELAKEVGRDGILVNNLLPGPTNTERLKELATKSPAFYETMAKDSALGRVGEPDEIGRVAAFLCSNANTFITGTDILADGGFTSAL